MIRDRVRFIATVEYLPEIADQRGRVAMALLVTGMLVVDALVIAQVWHAEYALIDDYRAFAMLKMGAA